MRNPFDYMPRNRRPDHRDDGPDEPPFLVLLLGLMLGAAMVVVGIFVWDALRLAIVGSIVTLLAAGALVASFGGAMRRVRRRRRDAR